ncbi:PH domain-containing protein [Arthrobacter sp. zg-Y1219]|uniref:PH domain-containing protein n=1 Tax=Arthrobacter sp. zg-Y1219 TaxID=3049067 RepID=UPI0024C442C4|nr:PH domain-containing protein [Arthrobacter sp. zg-Y1219]MDK1361037.1 PH domain-containing protein [Arthrobacter sp. zg-Y1219]
MTTNFGDSLPMKPGDLWAATGKPVTGFGGGRYRLTEDYLHCESGGLKTEAQQVSTREIVDVDLRQSLTQKARGVGSLLVHVVRQDGTRETVQIVDIPNFRDGVETINRVAEQARLRFSQEQRTQHVNYAGQMPLTSVPAATAGGPLAELRQVAGLHDRGVLDDVTFIAEVKRLLS